jgi:hypothetical protein
MWMVAGSFRLGWCIVRRWNLDNQHRCGVIYVMVSRGLVDQHIVDVIVCHPALVLFGWESGAVVLI